MTLLTDVAANLQFNPMAFVDNLKYMGIGMLVIFVIIGAIVLVTSLINKLTADK